MSLRYLKWYVATIAVLTWLVTGLRLVVGKPSPTFMADPWSPWVGLFASIVLTALAAVLWLLDRRVKPSVEVRETDLTLGISSRGTGTVVERPDGTKVIEEYRLDSFSLVGDPPSRDCKVVWPDPDSDDEPYVQGFVEKGPLQAPVLVEPEDMEKVFGPLKPEHFGVDMTVPGNKPVHFKPGDAERVFGIGANGPWAHDIVSVQPMTGPVGAVFFMEHTSKEEAGRRRAKEMKDGTVYLQGLVPSPSEEELKQMREHPVKMKPFSTAKFPLVRNVDKVCPVKLKERTPRDAEGQCPVCGCGPWECAWDCPEWKPHVPDPADDGFDGRLPGESPVPEKPGCPYCKSKAVVPKPLTEVQCVAVYECGTLMIDDEHRSLSRTKTCRLRAQFYCGRCGSVVNVRTGVCPACQHINSDLPPQDALPDGWVPSEDDDG